MKRLLAILFIFMVILSFGCTKETAAPKQKPLAKVGLYLPPFDDYFADMYDYAKKGIADIQKEYPIEVETVKVNDIVYESVYSDKLAKKSDVVVFMSFPLNPSYSELTVKYPKQHFIGIESYIDGVNYDEPENGSGIFGRDEEGGYLAGILAAKLTTNENFPGINKEKKLGFIGAMPSPWFMRDLGGFQYAVWSLDPNIKILEAWGKESDAKPFNRPDWAYKEAKKMYEEGVDIIFTVAGKGDEGVCKAAEETGKYAITMNRYKGYFAPGHVLAGINRRVDKMIYNELKNYLDQKIDKDKGIIKNINFRKGYYKVGISEDVIEINDLIGMEEETIWLKEGKINQKDFDAIKSMKEKLPQDIIESLASAQNSIIDGKLEVRESTGPVLNIKKLEGEGDANEFEFIE